MRKIIIVTFKNVCQNINSLILGHKFVEFHVSSTTELFSRKCNVKEAVTLTCSPPATHQVPGAHLFLFHFLYLAQKLLGSPTVLCLPSAKNYWLSFRTDSLTVSLQVNYITHHLPNLCPLTPVPPRTHSFPHRQLTSPLCISHFLHLNFSKKCSLCFFPSKHYIFLL